MKNILILLLFIATNLDAQVFIENVNSKNAFDIMVFLDGKLIHSHIMVPGDILVVETNNEILELRYKRLTNICDCIKDTPEYTKLMGSVENKNNASKPIKKGEWESLLTKTPRRHNGKYVFERHGVLPKYICPKA